MITVSLCMIVKNEEDVLARCLDSVKELVDEIVIVDTGSTDGTREIAARYTTHVYDFKWIEDFAAARNFAFSKATCQYCMWLDADDVILPPDRVLFAAVKQTLDASVQVVMMKYNTGFDEQGNVAFSYYRERLIRSHAGMEWKGAVHEAIEPRGRIEYSEFAVTHRKLHPSDPDRNLRIFEKLIRDGKGLEPRQQFYYGRELYYHERYEDAIRVFETFLDEGRGWMENEIDACMHCGYCYGALKRPADAIRALLRSFTFDLPRAEICCEIGRLFLEQERYAVSVYWYTRASACERNDARGGFSLPDCYGFIPYIQLCVAYSRMGDLEQAVRFNEKAALCKPDSPAVAHNRAYFDSLQKETGD